MSKCPNCGENASHFVPPSLGEEGFFICQAKKGRGEKPALILVTCPACGKEQMEDSENEICVCDKCGTKIGVCDYSKEGK